MDEVRIDIAAPPALVYDLIANVTEMGRWSPETYRTAWIDGATGPAAGARFTGWNRTRILGLPATWHTTCVVRQALPGRLFSFDTEQSGARWTYRIDPGDTPSTSRVTESRELVARPLSTRAIEALIGGYRRRQLLAGMHTTLERLKVAAEASDRDHAQA